MEDFRPRKVLVPRLRRQSPAARKRIWSRTHSYRRRRRLPRLYRPLPALTDHQRQFAVETSQGARRLTQKQPRPNTGRECAKPSSLDFANPDGTPTGQKIAASKINPPPRQTQLRPKHLTCGSLAACLREVARLVPQTHHALASALFYSLVNGR
jgi:hypothetical protein